MKHFKRSLSLVLALLLALGLMTVPSFAASDINVSVNGKNVTWTDAKPFIDKNNRTLVPLRAVADAMGLTVEWDAENRIASFSKTLEYNGNKIFREVGFMIDSSFYSIEKAEDPTMVSYGYEQEMDTAAVIVGGRTYAPIRYLAQSFDYTVTWDASTKTVQLEGPNSFAYMYDVVGTPSSGVAIVNMPGLGYNSTLQISTSSAVVDGTEVTVEKISDADLRAIEMFNGYADNILISGYLLKGVSSQNDAVITWTDTTTFNGKEYTNSSESSFYADNGQAW